MKLEYFAFRDNPAVLYEPSAGNKHVIATLGNMSYMVGTDLRCFLPRKSHVLIGNYCQIASDTIFEIGNNHVFSGVSSYPFDHVLGTKNLFAHRAPFNRQQLIIGHDVWIGSGARIIKAIKVGNGAIIGSGSVVTKDVPPYAIVGGNPAKVIRYRFPPETIEAIDQIKWWYWPFEKVRANWQYMNSQENVEKFIERFGGKNNAVHAVNSIAKNAVNNSNIRQTSVPPHILEKFQAYRHAGGRIFYFVPDLAASREDAAWPSVIGQFCQGCANRPHCLVLVLAIRKGDPGSRSSVQLLQEFMSRFPSRPDAMIFSSPDGIATELLEQADFFITTKEAISSKGIDYIETLGGRTLPGLEYDIFADAQG